MRTLLIAAALSLSTAVAAAPPPAAAASQPARTGPVKSGDAAPAFALPSAADGKTIALAELTKASKLTVVLFVATQCPVSNAYNARMAELAKAYAGKGVAFVGVNSNKAEPVAEIAAHAAEHGFSFPVVKDAGNKIADAYGAKVTPEVYVVDAQGVVRYHGRIDENQTDAANVKSPDLKNALDALLAGKQPASPETKAFGCSIKRL